MGNTIAFGGPKVHFRSRDGTRPRQIHGRECLLATSDRLVGGPRAGVFPPAPNLDRGFLIFLYREAGSQRIASKFAPDLSSILAGLELSTGDPRIRQFRLVAH